MSRDEVLLVNLSGRGDKDVLSVEKALAPARERCVMSRMQQTFERLRTDGRAGWLPT